MHIELWLRGNPTSNSVETPSDLYSLLLDILFLLKEPKVVSEMDKGTAKARRILYTMKH